MSTSRNAKKHETKDFSWGQNPNSGSVVDVCIKSKLGSQQFQLVQNLVILVKMLQLFCDCLLFHSSMQLIFLYIFLTLKK